ncbi:uncharacterized protein LOC135843942 [Planococcus citri]|uniref:uncharacterized protein LOC135843942 n=1 Tax=Planococcus citri TaxID=170843 RepID=UPI0031F8E604
MDLRVSFFFVTVILCNVLVRGQPPMPNGTPAPDPNAPVTPPPGTPPPPPPPPPGTPPPPPLLPTSTTPPPATAPPAGATPANAPLVQASPECAALPAKTMEDWPFVTGESIWWVGKLYVSASAAGATPTAPVPGATAPVPGATAPVPGATTPTPGATPCGDNTCSINTYKPDSCQAIKILISCNEDGSICLKEAVFNKASNSVALIKDMWIPADPTKAIVKQMYGYFGTMDQSGAVKIVDPGPADLKTAQSSDFVLLGAGEGGEWALFTSCCKSVVFVIYTDTVICAKSQKTFDQAICALLQPLGIKPEDLKDIPTDFPIKLDNFIPALPPATGATPAATTTSTTGVPPPTATTPAPPPPPPPATPPPATPPPATPPPATPPPP